ncbi:MAG: hypothetical protein ACTSUE_08340, partial [Promethearchaeota archaeon]
LGQLKQSISLDPGIVKSVLESLKGRGLLEISGGTGDGMVLSLTKPLNPVSSITLDAREGELISALRNAPGDGLSNDRMKELTELISRLTEEDPEKAGYIISILYLNIRVSGNHQNYALIKPFVKKMKDQSFYLRLIENIVEGNSIELRKLAILDGVEKAPSIIVHGPDFSDLGDLVPAREENAPFSIKKINTCSDVEGSTEIIIPESPLNSFDSISELANYAWFSTKLGSIKVTVKNERGDVFDVAILPGRPSKVDVFSSHFNMEAS